MGYWELAVGRQCTSLYVRIYILCPGEESKVSSLKGLKGSSIQFTSRWLNFAALSSGCRGIGATSCMTFGNFETALHLGWNCWPFRVPRRPPMESPKGVLHNSRSEIRWCIVRLIVRFQYSRPSKYSWCRSLSFKIIWCQCHSIWSFQRTIFALLHRWDWNLMSQEDARRVGSHYFDCFFFCALPHGNWWRSKAIAA